MVNKKIIDKFIKGSNNKYILIIVLIGIGMMLIPAFDEKGKEEVKQQKEINIAEEEKLEKILKKVDGISDVEVMISYYSTEKQDIAFEEKTQSSNRKEGDLGEDILLNNQKQAVMADGEPVILSKTYPKVKGVIVCYKGTDNETVKNDIIKAVTVVTGVMSHKVAILKMER